MSNGNEIPIGLDFARVTEIVGPHGTIIAFNYGSLPPDLAQEARDAVVRIHKAEDNFIFKAGDALAAIRQKMEHGRWLAWLEYEVDISDQTALNYIAYFEFLTQRADITLVGMMRQAPSMHSPPPEMVQDRLIKRAKDGERVTAKIVEMACRAQLTLEQQDEPKDGPDSDSDAPRRDDAAPEQDDVTVPSDADTTDDAAPEPLEEVAEAFAIALMKLLQANPQRSTSLSTGARLSRHAYQCRSS